MFSLDKHPWLSIVIPLYNESGCIEANLCRIGEYLKALNLAYELILVDDGSIDFTKAVCRDIVDGNSHVRLITYSINRGKGYALKAGMLEAAGKYIIFTDADLAVPVRFIGTCLKELESGNSMVICSRHLPESTFKIRERPLRQFLGEIFRRFSQISLGLRVSDVTCGLKGFSKEAAFNIFSRSRIERWGFDAEVVFLAQRLGYHIKEIPVVWRHSFDSRVNVAIDSARTLLEIFRIRHYFARKLYNC